MEHLDFQTMKTTLRDSLEGIKKQGRHPERIEIGNPYTIFWKPRYKEEDLKEITSWDAFMDIPVIVDPTMPADRIKIVLRNYGGLLDQVTIIGLMKEDA